MLAMDKDPWLDCFGGGAGGAGGVGLDPARLCNTDCADALFGCG